MRKCLFLLLLSLSTALSKRIRLVEVLNEEIVEKKATTADEIQELYITQRLDHFRPSSTSTFQQRYFYSDKYVKKDGASSQQNKTLALLCVGGEGPDLDKSVLIDSVHCSGDMLEFAKTLHKEYSIHLYALEHRYYGKSYPKFGFWDSPVSNHNLVYLSSRQALADIAHFIQAQPILSNAHWITFGGSYPGMLAAWARLKYPHLVSAAISSSAPVQPVLDFAAYNAHVAKAYADPNVGGSSQCLQVIDSGHAELVVTTKTKPVETANLFHVCDAHSFKNEMNLQLFLGDGVLSNVQGNDPACTAPYCNIQKTCDGLLSHINITGATNLTALAWLVNATTSGDDCLTIDWTATVQYISDPVSGMEGGLRSWLWQTCSEFGFYQTCEVNSTCPWGKGFHPLSQDLAICSSAFDMAPAAVAASIQSTLEYYGGWRLHATRVLSITGAVDPWSELALQKTQNTRDRPVYHVPGASHHFWTHPVKDSDSKEIQEARAIIFQTLRGWIDEMDHEKEKDATRVI